MSEQTAPEGLSERSRSTPSHLTTKIAIVKLSSLGDVIHAHPTVSEMVMDAAQQGEGVAPYLS